MGGAEAHSECGQTPCRPPKHRQKEVPKETQQIQDFPVTEHSSRDAGR